MCHLATVTDSLRLLGNHYGISRVYGLMLIDLYASVDRCYCIKHKVELCGSLPGSQLNRSGHYLFAPWMRFLEFYFRFIFLMCPSVRTLMSLETVGQLVDFAQLGFV